MTIEDLTSALKNALAHGENLDRAAASLVNAGYSQQEVDSAVRIVSRETVREEPKKISPNPLPAQTAQQVQLLQRPKPRRKALKTPKLGSGGKKLNEKNVTVALITLVSLLIFLLVGILFAILFG